jgi:hypothetical protein
MTLLVTLLTPARAQVPHTISYQGVIHSGSTVLSGQHVLHIILYDSLAGGNVVYDESHQTTIGDGVFSVVLGSVSSFPDALRFDRPYYLSISIDGAPELSPRTPLESAPYALSSHFAELANGLTSNARGIVTSINEASGAVRLIGDSTVVVTQSGNEITIHSKPIISGGNGIQSVSSPDNTISISNPTGPNTSAGVADNAISTVKLKDGSVTSAKLNQNGASTGQVLKWNGTSWVPSNDLSTTYTAGNGINISGNTISVSQPLPPGTVTHSTLRYNGTSWVENTNLLSTPTGVTTVNNNLLLSNLGPASELHFYEPSASGNKYSSFAAQAQNVDIGYLLPINPPSLNQTLVATSVVGTGPFTITLGWQNTSGGGWLLNGNNSTIAGTNFLGTTDNQAFEIHIFENDATSKGSKRVLRFEPNPTSANIIAGYQGNSISSSFGSVIAGGGLASNPNSITSAYSFIGGGYGNSATNTGAVISGGENNTAGALSAIAGGANLSLNNGSFGYNNATLGTPYTADLRNGGGPYDNIAYFGNVDLWLANTGGYGAGELRFYQNNSGTTFTASNYYSAFKAPSSYTSNSIVYILPSTQPTANQVLAATVITGTSPYNVTLGWANPNSGSGFVNYGPTSIQATLTPRTTPLFNIAYISTAADANAAGATITSSAGSAGDFNATALTLTATATGIGLARAIDATGRINIDNLSSYDIEGNRWLWEGPSHDATVTMVGNTGNTTNTGGTNVFVGSNAGNSNLTGTDNTAVGANALKANMYGNENVAIGSMALSRNITGMDNIAIGAAALNLNTQQSQSVAIGVLALGGSTVGRDNIAVGYNAAGGITTGINNSVIGTRALTNTSTGSNNTIIGYAAGSTGVPQIIADYNSVTLIGAGANTTGITTTTSLTNSTAIGANALVLADNSMVLGSINGLNSATADTKVGIGTTIPLQKFNIENGNVLLSRTGINSAGQLQLQGLGMGISTFAAGAQGATTINYTLPTSQPTTNQVLAATTITGAGPYSVTLGWADPSGSSGFVNYGPATLQATLTPRTTPLFNIAYLSSAPNANAAGASITSSAGSSGNFNATGLTLTSTGIGTGNTVGLLVSASGSTGNVRAIDATGRVNIDVPSSYDIAGDRFLWVGPSQDNTNVMVGVTNNTTNTGQSNTFAGFNAGHVNTTGGSNSFIGSSAGESNTTGASNTFVGSSAGDLTTTGSDNTFVGEISGWWNTTGTANTFLGTSSGEHNTTGSNNTQLGVNAGSATTSGHDNISLGYSAANAITTGYKNTILGGGAGASVTIGTSNTLLGYATDAADNLDNATAIGNQSYVGASNSLVLGSISGANGGTDVNVGIGTTTPLQKFNVENGNMLLSRTGTNAADTLQFQGTSTGKSNFVAGAQGTTNINYTLPTSQPATNQVLTATTITGNGPYAVTLSWADPSSGSGFVNYGPASLQATLTPRTTPLFNIAYLSTAADANAAGATITSSAGAAGNFNATALTLVATATGTGLARAINATGRINTNSTSSYDIGGLRFLWTGPNSSSQNTLVGNTGNTTNAANRNTFVGYNAGMSNDAGSYNTFVGAESGKNNNGGTGTVNTFIGAEAGFSNTYGSDNTYLGAYSGYLTTTGSNNIFIGENTGYSNIIGTSNTFIGMSAGWQSTADLNSLFGEASGWDLTTGGSNTFLGVGSGYSDTSGSFNVMIGVNAGEYHKAGDKNAYLGNISGSIDYAGTNNVMLGYNANPTTGSLSNAVAIGAGAQVGASNSMVLGSTSPGVNVGIGTTTPLQKFNVENGNILLSRTGTNATDTLLFQGTSTGISSFAAGAQGTTTINYTLPTAQPTTDQVLSATAITGSGPYAVTLGWATNGTTAWQLKGNSGTTPGTNFIGTKDSQAFEIHVYDGDAVTTNGDQRVMRYEYGLNSPTITGGYHGNTNNGDGAVIAGGGFSTGINHITSSGLMAAIGGGRGNTITGQYSVISGGVNNTVNGYEDFIGSGVGNKIDYLNALATAVVVDAVIGGGAYNEIKGIFSAIPGGFHLTLSDNSFGFNAPTDVTGAFGGADLTTGGGPYNNVAYLGNVDLWLGNTANFGPRQLRFYQKNSGSNYSSTTYYTSFQAPSSFTSSNISYTLPASAPAANGNLLLATSGASSTWSWSTGLVWDNTNTRLGINTTTPMHPLHSINSGTTNEVAAVYGNSTASTTNQAIGVWGTASSTNAANTGTIGMLATGNGNAASGQTNVALQINDGEFAMGRTTQAPSVGTDVNGATAGTAYSAEGPSGIVEFTLGAAGNLATVAPTANTIQDLGAVTINNRYCQSGSIVLVNVVGFTDDGIAPDPKDAAFIVNADNTAVGSFKVRIKMLPTVTNAANHTVNDKVRIGYMIINKSR